MTADRKLGSKELLFSLHRQADRDDVEAMSDAEVEAKLAAIGVSAAEADAKARALRRPGKDVLLALHRQADRDDVVEMSDAEVEAQLAAMGVSAAEADAKAKALREGTRAKEASKPAPAQTNGAKPALVIPLAPRRRRLTPFLLAAAILLVALGAAAYIERAHLARILFHAAEVPPPNPTRLDLAHNFVTQAAAACDDRRWQECADLADKAYDEDSAIASDPDFKMVRKASALGQVYPDKPWLTKLRAGVPVPEVPAGGGKEKPR